MVGYNNDMSRYAPTMQLTAPIWRWEPLFSHMYKMALDGNWKSENLWWGLKEGAVDLAPMGAMVENDVRALVEKYRQQMIDGGFDVFQGPVNDNQGNLKVAGGHTMSDDEMWNMDWFVQGVEPGL